MQYIDEQQEPFARIVVYTDLKTQEGIAKWISQQSKDYKTNLVNGVVNAIHSSPEGRKIKNKFTGAGIGAKFSTIMYRITTKNLKIGQRGVFEKMRFLYFHLMAQMQIFGPKMLFFGLKSIFF